MIQIINENIPAINPPTPEQKEITIKPAISNECYCPKCQSKQITNSAYCHVCGELIKKDLNLIRSIFI